jgi:membrane protein YqaA with SNARE-associated domain
LILHVVVVLAFFIGKLLPKSEMKNGKWKKWSDLETVWIQSNDMTFYVDHGMVTLCIFWVPPILERYYFAS